MRAIQKLYKHGSGTGVTIPRPMMIRHGWICGEAIIVIDFDDDSVLIRRPRASDFGPVIAPPYVRDDSTTGSR